jgi:cytochrome c biogenesis protein CcmG/thiol:disulfide interchange protein DsbE
MTDRLAVAARRRFERWGVPRLMAGSRLVLLLLWPLMAAVQSCGEGEETAGAAAGKETAADFTLETFHGGSFRLSNHKGNPVIVNFFASWCTLCGDEVSDLEKVYRDYAERGVILVGVAVQDTESKARTYVEKYGLTFPTGLDGDGAVEEAYGVYGLPMTYFIDGKGLIAYVHAGVVTEALMKHELEKIL